MSSLRGSRKSIVYVQREVSVGRTKVFQGHVWMMLALGLHETCKRRNRGTNSHMSYLVVIFDEAEAPFGVSTVSLLVQRAVWCVVPKGMLFVLILFLVKMRMRGIPGGLLASLMPQGQGKTCKRLR